MARVQLRLRYEARQRLAAAALLLATACSDPLGESAIEKPKLTPQEPSLEMLVISEARAVQLPVGASASRVDEIAYLSLPPRSLPFIATVRIRNETSGAVDLTVPVANGGFDPVPVPARADDHLSLTLTHVSGAVAIAYARVPAKRPPVVVRTYPTRGRTDVALAVIPTVIFSEPVDPGTLALGVRLFRGDEEVTSTVDLVPGQQWHARIVPGVTLEPKTSYELRVAGAVRDLDGDSLEAPINIAFSTDTAGASVPPRPEAAGSIIVSEPILDAGTGESLVYVSAAAGSLPGVSNVLVTNLRTNETALAYTPGLQGAMGGFEPAVIRARAGDSLWVRMLFLPEFEPLQVVVTVPDRREPVLLRIKPADGDVQVPLETFPTLVFSEPIESSTLAAGVRLSAGASEVAARFQVLPQAPWAIQVVPQGAAILSPTTDYQVHVTQSIEDLHGEGLAGSQSATFTTLAAPPAPGPAPAPPATSRIAFTSNRSGFDQVFVANGDGSGVRALADGFGPRWAPGGDGLVFARDDLGILQMRVIEEDGSDERFVSHGFTPSWSRDAAKILYVGHNDGAAIGLYRMAADGSNAELLLAGDALERRDGWWWWMSNPVQSPNGSIAFLWHAWNGIDWSAQRIWLIDADGSNPRPLSDAHAFARDPDWAADGERIAYVENMGTIRSVRADGSDPRVHFTAPDPDDHVASPGWSPDSRYIAFVLTRDNPYGVQCRIHVIDVETGAVGLLVPSVSDVAFPGYCDKELAWSR